ncbi:hypothetical protein IQ268_19105 [Oculatella sp. LEGE 06141]|uniref:hypothetical protein n=1 Tax=Oculatella sp. LEGE 06141 TaxID=1828648 RepID=UPI0018829974|nr:hypothetical protein [Oculatella sp. LEGE 06141]MBE9180672.1 hypothetical protein [Oculatella sp. LEGE 06141]
MERKIEDIFMVVGMKGLPGSLAIAVSIVMAGGSMAIAQDADQVQSIPEAFESEFFGGSGTFFENRRPPNNITWFIGPFPENQIASDAEDVHQLYRELLQQQVSSSPLIRTPDLDNPFNSSLLVSPTFQTERITGSEFVPQVPIAPAAPPQTPPTPSSVPALY